MLIRAALPLCFVSALLVIVSCGGRTDVDAVLNAAPSGGATGVVPSPLSYGDTDSAPATGGNLGTGGTASGFASSPMGRTASIGGTGTAIRGTVIVTFGGGCAVYYGGTPYSALISPALCGNGLMEYTNGEQCDDGNNMPGDGCSSDCRIEPNWNCPPCGPCISLVVCGDGRIQAGELCDDGNTEDSDGCSSTCKEQAAGYVCRPGHRCIAISTCGNSAIDPGEECDLDASAFGAEDGAACSKQCTFGGYCGDGEVQRGEECDEGLGNDALGCNGCTSTCKLGPYCGDGLRDVQCGEVCDDGINAGGYDSCGPGCTAGGPYCGDGVIQAAYGEECDHGASNGTETSACTHSCKLFVTLPE